jgi:hypothetical protein
MTAEHDPRYVRNRILRLLSAQHPDWVSDAELLIQLADQGCPLSEDRLRSELHYLRDWPASGAGYVELQIKAVPRSRAGVKQSRITPRGINLVERLAAPDDTIAEF